MKKIITLSLLSFILLAQESVNYLQVDQVNKIIDSTFSEDGVKSQGSTRIDANAFVDNVHILQQPNIDNQIPGNLIIDTTISSSGSQIHQGLTNVQHGAKLQDAILESTNSIENLQAISGESFVSQANIIIGEDSNVTKLINSTNVNIVGDGTADKFEIYEDNSLKDTTMKNTTIHQGLIVIKDGADVSNLKITQKNNIKRSDLSGQSEINATQITQGQIKVEDGISRNITQNIENKIDNLTVNESSSVSQSYIKSTQSELNKLNSKLNNLNYQDIVKNEIKSVDMENSIIEQSVIHFTQSSIDMLDKYNRGNGLQKNNLIYLTRVESDSRISQSSIEIYNNSILNNLEYFTANNPDSEQDAINEIKNLILRDESIVYQDKLKLNGATVENSLLSRTNRIQNTDIENESILYQFYTTMEEQTKLDETKLSGKSFVDDIHLYNSRVAQSATIIQ